MEKRRHLRHPIELEAQIKADGIQPISCVIKDFCSGGMLIETSANTCLLATGLNLGDELSICVQIPSEITSHSFQLRSRIVRAINETYGVSFIHAEHSALQALENHSNQLSVSKTRIKPSSANCIHSQRILTLCRRCISDNVTALMQSFFPEVSEALLDQAGSTKYNMVQSSFLSAEREISKKRREIITGFIKSIVLHFDESVGFNVSEQDTPVDATLNQPEKLELVEKDDFEGWLVTKLIITRANENYRRELLELKLRFTEIMETEIESQSVPAHPASFCAAFSEIYSQLTVEAVAEKVIYETFEKKFISKLGIIYNEINGILQNSGILPDLDIDKAVRSPRSKAALRDLEYMRKEQEEGQVRNDSHSKPTLNEKKRLSEIESTIPLECNSSKPDANHETDICSLLTQNSQISASNDSHYENTFIERIDRSAERLKKRFELQQKIARDAYKTATSLLAIARGEGDICKSNSSEGEKLGKHDVCPDQRSSLLGRDQVINILHKEQRKRVNAKDQEVLVSCVHVVESATNERIQNVVLNKLEAIDRLFESMLPELDSREAIQCICQLKLPVAKLVLLDDSFYENQIHPARLLINRIAELDKSNGSGGAKALESVQKLVASVVERFERNLEVFEGALEEINRLADVKNKIYRRNVNRVTEACIGRDNLIRAKKQCLEEIKKYSVENRIPEILLHLILSGWKEVMILSLLKPDEYNWNECKEVIAESVSIYEHSNGYKETSEIFVLVSETIFNVRGSVPGADDYLKHYKYSLENRGSAMKYCQIHEIVNIFLSDSEQTALELRNATPGYIWKNYPEYRKPLINAQNMAIGDWINCKRNDDNFQRLRLVWINDSHTSFTFVNSQGIKSLDLYLLELVEQLHNSNISVSREEDTSLVDRGLESMVQQAYGELQHQASHDTLTGLINRKEFDRQATALVAEAHRHDTTHVISCINLDQFKVVNNTCGLEAGDELLKDIANILKQWAPKNSTVARLGSDEYGLIIRHVIEDDAYQVVDNQLHAIEQYRFTWEDKSFSLSASAGMCLVSPKTESASVAIKSAVEASIDAKEAGRNRIHTFNKTDTQILERQDTMEWARRLTQAMEEDKLFLRGQKILPLKDNNLLPHYEVLLSVMSDNGEMLPPADFILAAEKYNRMHIIDRWVVKHVFEWLSNNRDNINEIGGLAINLSGHSMNDGSMLEYIFELFVKLEIPRDKVLFEVTETTAIANIDEAADFIREMRSIGCRFALDDFGVGLSSYGYLKHLPVDLVKIDGIFIKDIINDKHDYAMVKSIAEMAKFLGIKTVAEYVENDDILKLLREVGIDYAQGFEIEKPLPLDKIINSQDASPGTAALY